MCEPVAQRVVSDELLTAALNPAVWLNWPSLLPVRCVMWLKASCSYTLDTCIMGITLTEEGLQRRPRLAPQAMP